MQSAQGDALDPPSPSLGGMQSTAPALGGKQSTAPLQAPSPVVSQGAIIHPRTRIMGGIIQSSKDEFSVWMGGKRKANWSVTSGK